MRHQKVMTDATHMAMFSLSLQSSFDMMGYTDKTSVNREKSPKTIRSHTYINREYMCHWDCTV